jgi:hypothetical protein
MARIPYILAVAILGATFSKQAECRNGPAAWPNQETIASQWVRELPSEITSFAQSGDGALIWVACEDRPPSERLASAADTSKKAQTEFSVRDQSAAKTTVYAVDINSGLITTVTQSQGPVRLVPSPVGAQIVLVLPRERSNGRSVLYERTRQIAELPIDPYLLVWSADGSRIYFYGGTTIQADAWNILGVLRVSDLALSRVTLLEPTESVHVCNATGHVFTGDAFPSIHGKLEANTVEYDSDLREARRIMKFPAGRFSAYCCYVATEQSFHGPLAWEIVEVATGQQLMRFDFTGEGKKNEFEFHSWNPRRDDIFLRLQDPTTNFQNGVPRPTLQVFDLRQRRVLESLPNFSGQVAWSRSGNELIFSRGHSLILHPIVMGAAHQ